MDEGSRPARVGLALIAKNEAERLPTLLASIDGAFDRVVLLDTGSDDDTVVVFTDWCLSQAATNSEFTWQTGHVGWGMDFALARRQSFNLLTHSNPTDDLRLNLGESQVDWTCWADCDDEIVGAQHIRTIVTSAPPHVVAFLVDYDYARDPSTGVCLSYLRRERMVRSGHGNWQGRVHEAQTIERGNIVAVNPADLLYVHRKPHVPESTATSNTRNLELLEKWAEDEPDNPRVLGYLGIENAIRGEHDTAVDAYVKYLSLHSEWDEERAQVCSRLASSLMALERNDEAIDAAMLAFRVLPSWPDTYIRLAEAYLAKGEPSRAEHWARLAIERGAPEGTLLIVNPMDYQFQPYKLLAGALGDQGKIDEAINVGRHAMSVFADAQLGAALNEWHSIAKREHTADTFVICAQQLIAHDEQLKALKLLEECVPAFATDHPKVVAARSSLRERIAWMHTAPDFADHYETGGSKPEDFIPDENVDPLCAALPRAGFLLDGVLEQINDA